MKRWILILLALPLIMASCSDDDAIDRNVLAYDGDNENAPSLPQGTFQAAAKFTSGQTGQYQGQTLGQIEYFMFDVPEQVTLLVYGEGPNSDTPGQILYSADVTNQVRSFSYNRHNLTSQVPISGDDLWIAVEVVHNQSMQSIGCDAGPAVTNGNRFYDSFFDEWETYRSWTNDQVSINWNVRGYIE